MDSFCEQLVVRENTAKLKRIKLLIWLILIIVGGLAASFIVYLAMKLNLMTFVLFAIIILVGSIYMAIKFCKALNIEYEYEFTNGTFDIDRISAHTNRQRLLAAECKNIEALGKYVESEHANRHYDKTVSAVSSLKADDIFYVIIRQPEIGKVLVLIQPDNESLEHILQFMPRTLLAEFKRNNPDYAK